MNDHKTHPVGTKLFSICCECVIVSATLCLGSVQKQRFCQWVDLPPLGFGKCCNAPWQPFAFDWWSSLPIVVVWHGCTVLIIGMCTQVCQMQTGVVSMAQQSTSLARTMRHCAPRAVAGLHSLGIFCTRGMVDWTEEEAAIIPRLQTQFYKALSSPL